MVLGRLVHISASPSNPALPATNADLYLVVWQSESDEMNLERFEIEMWGRIYTSLGVPTGDYFRISFQGGTGIFFLVLLLLLLSRG